MDATSRQPPRRIDGTVDCHPIERLGEQEREVIVRLVCWQRWGWHGTDELGHPVRVRVPALNERFDTVSPVGRTGVLVVEVGEIIGAVSSRAVNHDVHWRVARRNDKKV